MRSRAVDAQLFTKDERVSCGMAATPRAVGGAAGPVGCGNSGSGCDLRLSLIYAARLYSLIRPLRTSLRFNRTLSSLAAATAGCGGCRLLGVPGSRASWGRPSEW